LLTGSEREADSMIPFIAGCITVYFGKTFRETFKVVGNATWRELKL